LANVRADVVNIKTDYHQICGAGEVKVPSFSLSLLHFVRLRTPMKQKKEKEKEKEKKKKKEKKKNETKRNETKRNESQHLFSFALNTLPYFFIFLFISYYNRIFGRKESTRQ